MVLSFQITATIYRRNFVLVQPATNRRNKFHISNLRWDPDILVGYETQMGSIGYLVERGSHLGRDLCAGLSRVPDKCMKKDWMADDLSDIVISGRIILNLWRIIKHEIVLRRYTLENVVFHILHERIPKYSFQSLTNWFNHEKQIFRWRVIDYYTKRTTSNLDLMDRLNLIGRTSEFARVFGIEFYHVLSRGSQYRVESMMLRLAKPLNFIPISPNDQQRAKMKAPECIPLTLEPEAKFYSHPVVVLDFQSLYPSIMIAYNYCFSTCLGRLVNLANTQDGAIEFGCSALSVQASLLRKLKDDVTISPNGVVFVKQYVRKGIISSMVEEILNTRLMVKKELKECKNKGLLKLLDARQLGLKLIANVTYGYTGANFSGRMPCIEVGDSIVRKARETLERAIELVENSPKWGAKVVYGDTDSMFIELQGRTKDEAFRIGHEIAEEVTMMNPKPVKLKFEKVYLPCILQAKKRYFGFMYEKPEQEEPVFDAKGVETVRRDNCEAASKILEKSIKILFTTKDISRVKEYVIKQCIKLLHERISIQDCVFAKEYRGLSGYKPGARVPALEIAKKLLRGDRRAEPRVGERVPYVIVYGSPGLPLIQLIKQPMEVVRDPSLHLNTAYYITKQILPPLQRFLSLLGTDALSWYQEMPRIVKVIPPSVNAGDKKATISEYFGVVNCPGCGELTKRHLCVNCQTSSQIVMTNLKQQICQPETIHQNLTKMCASCMGVLEQEPSCISLDCPVQFRLNRAKLDCKGSETLREVLCIFFEDV